MNQDHKSTSCLVVGAGLSGLLAAQKLQDAGLQVTVLEANNRVGGRLASYTLRTPVGDLAVLDHGAQYFTVRSDRFRRLVQAWLAADRVRKWSDGFATPHATTYRDGHPRYRGHPTMAALAAHLTQDLDVRAATPVKSVQFKERWTLTTVGGDAFHAQALILTPPVPQSLSMLDDGGVDLPPEVRADLAPITYDACLALLLALDGPSAVPAPGGLWPNGPAISWIADNAQKGVSPVPAVTVHASPEFSNEHVATPQEEVTRLLRDEAAPWLGADVVAQRLVRWRHSIPRVVHSEPVLFCATPAPLAFAGDAFAGPRVEGAVLSGIAAAETILSALSSA